MGSLAAMAQSKSEIVSGLQAWRSQISNDQKIESFEKDLRISFLSRLIFQTERNYQSSGTNNELKNFMIQSLKTFLRIDQMNSNKSLGSNEFFLSNLLQGIQEDLEPTEDVLLFMRAYLEYSGISDPADCNEFAYQRSYINGDQLVAVNPLEIEEASSFVAEKLESEPEEENLPVHLLDPSQELMPRDLMFENSLMPYRLSSRP
jgi:hypothetical protein